LSFHTDGARWTIRFTSTAADTFIFISQKRIPAEPAIAVSDFKVNGTRGADINAHGARNAEFPVKERIFFFSFLFCIQGVIPLLSSLHQKKLSQLQPV
jgi:hypothetical protein